MDRDPPVHTPWQQQQYQNDGDQAQIHCGIHAEEPDGAQGESGRIWCRILVRMSDSGQAQFQQIVPHS